MLEFLQSLAEIKELSLGQLTKKLATLLALVMAQRCQTLATLDTRFMQELADKTVFTIRDNLKTTRPRKHQDPRLSPVAHIGHYIARI